MERRSPDRATRPREARDHDLGISPRLLRRWIRAPASAAPSHRMPVGLQPQHVVPVAGGVERHGGRGSCCWPRTGRPTWRSPALVRWFRFGSPVRVRRLAVAGRGWMAKPRFFSKNGIVTPITPPKPRNRGAVVAVSLALRAADHPCAALLRSDACGASVRLSFAPWPQRWVRSLTEVNGGCGRAPPGRRRWSRTSLPARMSSSAGASLVVAAESVATAETDQVGGGRT